MGKQQETAMIVSATGAGTPLPPLESVRVRPRPPTGRTASDFAFENLAFEGGGAKGYAYIGAIQVLEEEGIYPDNVRRVAGTSVGSMFALLASTGCSTDYMLEKVPADIESLAKDGSGGQFLSFARAARRRGMHPGQRLYDFLGSILEDTTGSADCTFAQLLERCGRELCIPVTNVTRMMTEFCHLKTTPNMPVRVATRMSMSLPVMLQPVNLLTGLGRLVDPSPEVYVDGGLLCNNPTHVFDGWWLSLDPKDSFLRRLRPLERAAEHYPRSSRFYPANTRTLGFTLFADEENDITRTWLAPGAVPPARPDTPAAHRANQKERAEAATRAVQAPVQRVLDALDANDIDSDGRISASELASAITGVDRDDLLNVFGSADSAEIFAKVNTDGSDTIEFGELLAFLETIGLDITTQLVGFPARPPRNTLEFAMNMLEAVNRDLARSTQGLGDRDRTIPINTDYIGTTTFDLTQEDLNFMVATGRQHAKAFLDARRGR